MTVGVVPDSTIRRECCCAASSSFIGRRGEIREIKSLLSDHRLVTLTGPGGVGKSRLAHRVAASLRRGQEDEVCCIDLVEAHDAHLLTQEFQDPDLLAHLVAGSLGLHQDGAAESGTALEALAASLALRPALLLLDNCEQVLPSCAVLVEALLRACPRLRIVATSREPLRIGGETVFAVKPLSTPEAVDWTSVAELVLCDSVALFVTRAEAVSSFTLTEQNASAVAELCCRLEGLPLAVELAAARTPALAPAQILQRMSERFGLLSRGNRSAPVRQRTLLACVDWSFELCSKPERLLWARLSVFSGTFELEAAEGVCTDDLLPASELMDQLAGLVEKSILVSENFSGGLRYRMSETIRDYGRRKLAEDGWLDEFGRRRRDWYEQLVRRSASEWFSPRQAEWFARLDREMPNVRAALAHGLADPEGADGTLDLAAGLWQLFAARGWHLEGRRWLDQALSRPTAPTMSRVEALFGTVALAGAQGDRAAVRTGVDRLREAAAQLGDARAEVIVACGDAILASTVEPAEAIDSWRRAVDRAAGGQAPGWHAVALSGLATATAVVGDVEGTQRCHDEIVALCPPHGEFLVRGMALGALGLGLWKFGDLKGAAARLREGLRLLHRVDGIMGVTWCLEVLAWIAADEGHADQAATLFGAVGRFGQAAGLPAVVPWSLAEQHEQSQQGAWAALGDVAYQAAFTRGENMSVTDAIAYGIDARRLPAPPPTEPTPTLLTRREQQVAELVAKGQSNKDIAAALFISRRTAESHVEKILIKLGFSNRAQVAAWMAAQRTHTTTAG